LPLKNFNSNTIEGTEISVDGAAAELSEILFSAAKSSLNRCKVYKKDSPKNKQIFYLVEGTGSTHLYILD
jgi:hypothetical protein